MTKTEKNTLVDALAAELEATPSFYVLDMGGMSVEQTTKFRRKLHAAGMSVRMVKNTLIKKALDKRGVNHDELDPVLKQPSSLIFVSEEAANAPAKLLKDHFKEGAEFPKLKGAFIEEAAYVGAEHLDNLAKLKSKQELLGEVIGLLQSPISNVLGALQSGGTTLHGLLQTLSEREKAA